jgi:DNA-binding NarL/FixJ family response regulator
MDVLLASARSDLRFALEVLLREEPGVSVVGTATGTEGLLALIGTNCPDLVIFDWELPGRPPGEVLAAVRALSCSPDTIVLGKDNAARDEALVAGADTFVLRGTPPQALLTAVQQVRTQRAASAGGRVAEDEEISLEAKGE